MIFRNIRTTGQVLGLCVWTEEAVMDIINGKTTPTTRFVTLVQEYDKTALLVSKMKPNSKYFEICFTIMHQFEQILVKGLNEQQSIAETMVQVGKVANNAISAFETAGLYEREKKDGIQE